MTDENLFSTDTQPNVLDQLVGEGKKFRTIEDLAKAKLESDSFIQRLQDENKGIRDDLNARVRMEQLLEKLEEVSDGGTDISDNNQSRNNSPDNRPDLETIIEQKLTKRDAEQKASSNVTQVKDALRKYFGDNYEEKLKTRIDDLDLDPKELNDLAKKSPKAFLKLVGIGEQRQDIPTYTPPSSRTNAPVSLQGGQRDYNYYKALRTSNPSEYWKPEVQLQLHKDAIAAANRGEDFYKK